MNNVYGLNRTLGAAIAAIALVSALSGAVMLSALGRLDRATEARVRSDAIIHAVDAFQVAMLNQETGLRGFLITGRDTSLAPYRAGRNDLDASVAALRSLIGRDPAQQERLEAAVRSARSWQTDVGEAAVRGMVDPSTRTGALAIEAAEEGKRRFDDFRAKLADIGTAERSSLDRQSESLTLAQRDAGFASVGGLALTLVICACMALALHRLIVFPLGVLAQVMGRLAERDLAVEVTGTGRRNEVGAMARAVQVFKDRLIELDRISLLRAATDTLPAMVGYFDARRRVGFLNGEFARWFDLGVGDVSELHGRPMGEVFAAERFPGAGRELETAFAGADARFEHRLALRGMGLRELEVFYRPHVGPSGTVLGVVTLLTDITERKAVDRRLARQTRDLLRSNEELEQFAYVASHDLKAPLRGIENLVTWIQEDLEEAQTELSESTQTNMKLLKTRVVRLESLLDDLLAYSRAGRSSGAAEAVDTQMLVEELAVLVAPPEGFAIEAAPSLPTLQAPRAPLTQVFQNLIGNALKHHDRPAGGRIRVDGAMEAGIATFTVSDDGPGIPERFRERVFGMFQTLRPRDEVEGSGMGLAIVKKLIERQGGRISLGDGGGGRGLTVRFTWPVDARDPTDGADGEPAPGR